MALVYPLDVRCREKTKGGFGGIRAEPSKKMIGILWAVGSPGRYYPQLLLKVPESKNTGNERVRRPPKPPVAYLNVRLNQSGEWVCKQNMDSLLSPNQPVPILQCNSGILPIHVSFGNSCIEVSGVLKFNF